jgi:hypothetical protein
MRSGVVTLLGALLGALLTTSRADASCAGRPTDPAGFQGYAYTGAAPASLAGARVRVHYATTGVHAVDPATTRSDQVPDAVALAAAIGDKALGRYAELGFRAPPADTACASNGGDDKLDIYLVAFTGADGQTVPESCAGHACSSFALVESTFAGRGYPTVQEGFETVVAHELFHAVQNAYDSELDRFWAEGTAQWAMKIVYPGLTDFEGQLPAFFKAPSRSLDTQPSGVTSGFLYGSAVWPLFLSLRHGQDTVRDILEREADGTKAVPATEAALAARGSSLAADYPLFGAWNAATKALAGDGGYPDAARYPGVTTAALVEGATAITSGLSYYAFRGALDAPSRVSLEADPSRIAGVTVPIVGGKPQLGSAVALPATVEGDVLVVVAGTTTKKTDAAFTLHLGPPDPAGSTSGDGGASAASSSDSGSGGGCAVSAARPGLDGRAALAVALAGVLLLGARALSRGPRGRAASPRAGR